MITLIATIFTLIIAPLNAVFFLNSAIQEQFVPEENLQIGENLSGEVQGVEKKNEDLSAMLPPPAPIQPVKKEGSVNLAVPTAHSSLILDVDSGTIIHMENGKEKRQIASLTKLMTAVLVMEKIKDLDEVVTIDQEAVYVDGTRVGCPRSGYCPGNRLKVGEKIKARELLKAMLMNSANDAALALAKHIGGTESRFVEMMNAKAKELNLNDTHFCTASGLEIEGRESECYSSAYDVAIIGSYSMKYDLIWEIFRMPNNTEISSVDGTCTHNILNTDLVLNEIPNCLGGKTGFTPLAGRSLLIAAHDGTSHHEVIAVVLDDPYRWGSVKEMIKWAFENYEWK